MAKWVIKSTSDYQAALRSIQKRFDGLTENIKSTTKKAVTDIALECLEDSVERAPVEIGDLRGSGYVKINGASVAKGFGDENGNAGIEIIGTPGETEDNRIVAEIGYDNQTCKYAFVQHEHVEFNHPMGGQAKYLESVVVENEDKWKKHLIDAVKGEIDNSGF